MVKTLSGVQENILSEPLYLSRLVCDLTLSITLSVFHRYPKRSWKSKHQDCLFKIYDIISFVKVFNLDILQTHCYFCENLLHFPGTLYINGTWYSVMINNKSSAMLKAIITWPISLSSQYLNRMLAILTKQILHLVGFSLANKQESLHLNGFNEYIVCKGINDDHFHFIDSIVCSLNLPLPPCQLMWNLGLYREITSVWSSRLSVLDFPNKKITVYLIMLSHILKELTS